MGDSFLGEWSVFIISRPKGFAPKSPDERPRRQGTPGRLLAFQVSQQEAERRRQIYNRMSLRRGLDSWAAASFDSELAGARDVAESVEGKCREHGVAIGLFLERSIINVDVIECTVDLTSDGFTYGGELTPEMAIAVLREKLLVLEQKLATERLLSGREALSV